VVQAGARPLRDVLTHFFVEQGGNFTHDPFQSVADSAEYVKRVLLK